MCFNLCTSQTGFRSLVDLVKNNAQTSSNVLLLLFPVKLTPHIEKGGGMLIRILSRLCSQPWGYLQSNTWPPGANVQTKTSHSQSMQERKNSFHFPPIRQHRSQSIPTWQIYQQFQTNTGPKASPRRGGGGLTHRFPSPEFMSFP